MTSLIHRSLITAPPLAVRGEGIHIFDASGKRYIDASGGAAVSCLGHQNEHVIKSIKDQADNIAYAHTGFFTSDPAENLANKIIENAPEPLEKVYLVSGGSEAVESALKMARQFHWERGDLKRHKIIARKQSYHGNTLGALAVGGNEWRREKFEPMLMDVGKISPCYEYRFKSTDETPEEYGLRSANELEEKIIELGEHTVSAFIAETVVGATSGAVPPTPGYFKRIREICDRYGVLLILDEVMCGVGRTGSWFSFEQDNIVPDMVTIAKGLAAGYQPIGALVVTKTIYDALKNGSGFFQHGYTFMGHSIACAAALATLDVIEREGLVDQAKTKGLEFSKKLKDSISQYQCVGDIRGRGLFQAIEFVKDKEKKLPFPENLKLAAELKKKAFEKGLICYPMSGTIDGRSGDHILLAPPYILNSENIDEIVNLLSRTIEDIEKNLSFI